MAALLLVSAWLILGHFLHIFYGFSSKLPEIVKFSHKIVIFLSFSILLYLPGSKFCPGSNFQFSADFHKYTLNMTSYHVTGAINGYF